MGREPFLQGMADWIFEYERVLRLLGLGGGAITYPIVGQMGEFGNTMLTLLFPPSFGRSPLVATEFCELNGIRIGSVTKPND
jgi:hypothetical protein